MTATYTPISTITTTSAVAFVSFTNIANTFKDLILTITYDSGVQNRAVILSINSDFTASNYQSSFFNVAGGTRTYVFSEFLPDPKNGNYQPNREAFRQTHHHIIDYSATNKRKVILTMSGSGTSSQMRATAHSGTSAVTSLDIRDAVSGNLEAGIRLELYGIVG